MTVHHALVALVLAGAALAVPAYGQSAADPPRPPVEGPLRADPGAPSALLPSPPVSNPGSAPGGPPGAANPRDPGAPSAVIPSGPPVRPAPPAAPPRAAVEEIPGGDPRALIASIVGPDTAERCLGPVAMPPATSLPGQRPTGSGTPPAAPSATGRAPATRVVIAVDASGSMAGRSGAGAKMEAALRAARRFLDTLGPEVEVGLVVFGHRGSAANSGRAASCAAAESAVPLAPGNRAEVAAVLDRLRPVGWTPLAAAMETAARSFRPSDREGEQLLLVISDGVETCGGDPAAVARRLNTGDLRVVVDIVGFDVAANERAALEAVARAGGGAFANLSGANLSGAAAEEALRRSREGTLNAMAAARARTSAAIQAGRAGSTAGIGIARAQSCVNIALAREQTALNTRLIGRPAGGRVPPAVADEARGLLAARHAAIRTQLDAYVAAVSGVRDARVEEIGRALTQALKPPPR